MSTPKKLYIYKDDLKEKDNAFLIRIPNMWKDNVESWFLNFEALTNNLNHTDDERANNVISQLDAVDKALMSDIVEYPPLNGFYEALKNRLVSLYQDSNLEVQAKLVVWSSESFRRSRILVFEELRRSGDTLSEYINSCKIVITLLENFAISAKLEKQAPKESTSELVSVSQSLNRELKDVSSYSLNKPSSSNMNKSKKARTLPFCYYHERFGSEAINCAPPCGYHHQ